MFFLTKLQNLSESIGNAYDDKVLSQQYVLIDELRISIHSTRKGELFKSIRLQTTHSILLVF